MTRLFELYRSDRLIHVNVNVVLAGIAGAALTTAAMLVIEPQLGPTLRQPGSLAGITAAVDGVLDLLVFASLHWLVTRNARGPEAKARELAVDTLRLQVQRWVLTPLFYVVAIAIQWLLLAVGVSLAASLWIAYLSALLLTRVTHSVWGLRTGQFEPTPALYRLGRLALARYRRLRHWEFWSTALRHAPVVPYMLLLALRHRSLMAWTACNPGIPTSGLVGESKWALLRELQGGAPQLVARCALVPAAAPVGTRLARAEAFMMAEGLGFPIVAKPDVGERGAGVVICRDRAQLRDYLERARLDTVLQAYAPGREFGLYYAREPGEARGRVLGVCEKCPLELEGDGVHDLEHLILADERAVCLAELHLERHADRLRWVPAAGERVTLTRVGAHSLGSVFLDRSELLTPALEAAADRLAQTLPDVHLGRFDVKATAAELATGQFLALEFNGVGAEAAHHFDPSWGALRGWASMFRHWRLAYRYGAYHQRRGAAVMSYTEMREAFRQYHGETVELHAYDWGALA